MANIAMVRATNTDVLPVSFTTSTKEESIKESKRRSTTASRTRSKISGVENFRNFLKMDGISKEAATLISQSRRESSIANYDSSFQMWVD